jgi:hypothetical protein
MAEVYDKPPVVNVKQITSAEFSLRHGGWEQADRFRVGNGQAKERRWVSNSEHGGREPNRQFGCRH